MQRWKNRAVKALPWMQETALKKLTMRWFVIQTIGAIIATFLLLRLVVVAQTIPPVAVKTTDGAYMTLTPGTQLASAPMTEAEMIHYCETVIETALTRNETLAPVETLKPYTTSGFAEALAANFTSELEKGYFQTFRVDRSRVHRGSRNFILLRMQGILASGTLEFYTRNQLTLEVAFRRFPEPRVGEAQWKAHGIVPIPAIEYDPEAVQDAINENTKIED